MQKISIDASFPVTNAAGECKSLAEVVKLSQTTVSAIVVGSITLLKRDGNPGQTFNGDLVFGLNALGLPNPGIEEIKKVGPEMIRVAHAVGKPIILSVAGFSVYDYYELARSASDIGFDGVELNLGCPNVVDCGKREPIFSYRSRLVHDSIASALGGTRPGLFISVKVSPMDAERLCEIASVINVFRIQAVVTQNTVPYCLDFNPDGTTVINTPDGTGYAGGSGKQIFMQALGQVKQWRGRLPAEVEVWGVGGVQSGDDVRKMLRAGASVVQVGTAYFVGGAKVFGDIANEYVNGGG
jgi:dihydroorotate dehydrogenase (fumarate)